jgi:hypothetical protein
MKMSDDRKHWSGLEPQQRADSPQVLPDGSASMGVLYLWVQFGHDLGLSGDHFEVLKLKNRPS